MILQVKKSRPDTKRQESGWGFLQSVQSQMGWEQNPDRKEHETGIEFKNVHCVSGLTTEFASIICSEDQVM